MKDLVVYTNGISNASTRLLIQNKQLMLKYKDKNTERHFIAGSACAQATYSLYSACLSGKSKCIKALYFAVH